MSIFRSGLGLSCCHDCCPQCYPLSVCEDSDGCPESGVYVSCKAADWLDEQGAGYTIIYNPQCCLTWNGKTGDEECEDVLEDGAVVIYSEGDDQPSKPIQGYKTGDCEDCVDDPDIVGACCYEYRGSMLCAQVTEAECTGAVYNGTYHGDGTCCAGASGCLPPWEIECDDPPPEVDCTKYAGQCQTKGGGEVVVRCSDPVGSATDCLTTYSFNLTLGTIPLSTGTVLNQSWAWCDEGGCDGGDATCCDNSMTSNTLSAPIFKEAPLLELWSTQGTSQTTALDGAWHCGTANCVPSDCPEEDCGQCFGAGGQADMCSEITGCFGCPCCSATKFMNWYYYVEIEETSEPPSVPLGDNECYVSDVDSCSVWTVKLDLSFGTNSCISAGIGCGWSNCPNCDTNPTLICYTHVERMIWKVRVPKCACPDEVNSNNAHVIAIERTGVANGMLGYWNDGSPTSNYERTSCVGACDCAAWIPWIDGGLVTFWADWLQLKKQIRWDIS